MYRPITDKHIMKFDTPVADGNIQSTLFTMVFTGVPGPEGPQGPTGDPGPQGPAGYTPVRGVDYWTPADRTEISTEIDDKFDKLFGDIGAILDEINGEVL